MFLMFGCVNDFDQLSLVSEKFFSDLSGLTKKDHLIVYTGIDLMKDERTVKWLEERPVSTPLLDADGYVFKYYSDAEKIRKFGGVIHRLSNSVFHFANSGVYTIGKRKVLIANIGSSKLDKEPAFHKQNQRHFTHLLASLEKHDNKVDYVISVLPPYNIAKHFSAVIHNEIYSLYMDEILRRCEFEDWYFSGTNTDLDFENFHSVHRSIMEIDGKIFTESSDSELDFTDYL